MNYFFGPAPTNSVSFGSSDLEPQVETKIPKSLSLLDPVKLMRALIKATPVSKGRRNMKHGKSSNHPIRSIMDTSFSANSSGVYKFPLTFQGSTKSSGISGTAYEAIALNPSAATNWSALAALFDVYRIDSFTLSIIQLPVNTGSTAPSGGIMAVCVDTDSTTPPTSIDQCLQYDNVWTGSVQNPPGAAGFGFREPAYKYRCPRASNSSGAVGSVNLGQWVDIAHVAGTGSIFIASELTTPSVILHTYVLELVVEFKFIR